MVDALEYGEKQLKLYDLLAWVVMANHVHIVIYPNVALSKITRSIKGFSARRANAILQRTGPFWMEESYDHWVRSETELDRIVQYIEGNPIAAGLCDKPEDWRWSSASAGREACAT